LDRGFCHSIGAARHLDYSFGFGAYGVCMDKLPSCFWTASSLDLFKEFPSFKTFLFLEFFAILAKLVAAEASKASSDHRL
jgi:hypothetical protein